MRLAVSVFSHNADDILDIVMSNIKQRSILCLDSSSIDIILKFTFDGSQIFGQRNKCIDITLAPPERGSV